MIHLEVVQFIVRSYDDGMSFENKDPYRGVMNVNCEGDRAYAFAMHGELTKEDYDSFLAFLKEQGYTKLYMNRNGTRQVTKL